MIKNYVIRYDGNGNFELAQELELSSTDGDAGAEILVRDAVQKKNRIFHDIVQKGG